ncbi:MAG: radical SAM protein [Methanobacteriota archaeon]|nr:MAG: radical SAM protein [Euryarchaeota archaeon]
MHIAIVDCYTDEPAGLGVPPYLGTYPRYVAGVALAHGHTPHYLTIDDLRLKTIGKPKRSTVTRIDTLNTTRPPEETDKTLRKAHIIVVIAGIHTPGKYLSAKPGSPGEAAKHLEPYRGIKILGGPATHGTSQMGGRRAKTLIEGFDLISLGDLEAVVDQFLSSQLSLDGVDPTTRRDYGALKEWAVRGATIVKQHPCYGKNLVCEVETGRGCVTSCFRGACSFCVEPKLYPTVEHREQRSIHEEVWSLVAQGVEHLRLGRQACFYSYKHILDGDKPKPSPEEIEKLLKPISVKTNVHIKTLHIDNVNPSMVAENQEEAKKITKLLVQHCSPGNVAAFGVESFDPRVIKANNLGTQPEQVLEACRTICLYGKLRGENGMPTLLPGINLILGLKNETKQTLDINLEWLKKLLEENIWLRRINIRKLAIFPGTGAEKFGTRYLRKNVKYYYSWKKLVRSEIDHPMLKRILPHGTKLKNVFLEIHRGNTTYGRQPGTYPIIVGINGCLPLKTWQNVVITEHGERSVTGVPC